MSEKLKCVICVGISASGKSTFAKDLQKRGWMQLERDIIRRQMFGFKQWNEYKFNKTNEERVTIAIDALLENWAKAGFNVVCSDTNLNPKYRNALVAKLKSFGYEVEIKDFPISYEEAVKRDTYREYSVGQAVIYQQWKQWLDYINFKKYTPSGMLPDAVIFDVDGTLAEMHDRSPFEWSKVGQDLPRYSIFFMLDGYAKAGYEIIFLSGRDSICRTETTKWLNNQLYSICDCEIIASDNNLFMRKEGDMRKDSIIKQELFWEHVAPKWDVQIVVDDRPQIVEMYYDMGIRNVITVADQRHNF